MVLNLDNGSKVGGCHRFIPSPSSQQREKFSASRNNVPDPALHSNQRVYDLALIHAQEGHILCGRKPAVRGFVIWELSKDVVRVTIASDMPIFGANSAAHVARHVA